MYQFYPFGFSEKMKDAPGVEILGGKGAGLVWMDKANIPVPPGFVIPTGVWEAYDSMPGYTMQTIKNSLGNYCEQLIKHFGYMPLVSVRSGARVSCPGMMDTILNVGIDEENKDFWKSKLGAKCFEDSYHRLITMYGSVVMGLDRHQLEKGFSVDALAYYVSETGEKFPNASGQVLGAIEAVFKSWDNERAKVYRKQHDIPREWGTAVTVQSMVFGNLNDQSATGVLFTRNPDTGEQHIKGEFLVNAQGEDVVAGIRTPLNLQDMEKWNATVYANLCLVAYDLEHRKKDVQDIEFTVQDGKLYILQTRNAKRSAQAAVRIAVDMAKAAPTDAEKAKILLRVTARQYDLAQLPTLASGFKKAPNLKGIAACSGVVTGKPVFSAKAAIACKEPCILITKETTPEDYAGMLAAKGVITMEGGLTSHAAVVARGENIPCVTGVGASLTVFEGCDKVSFDGSTGNIWLEEVPISANGNSEILAVYSEMLFKSLGAIPVLYGVPKRNHDSALLVLGNKILEPEMAADMILKTVGKCSGTLYVDLSIAEPEVPFFSICATFNPQYKVMDELAALLPKYPVLKNLVLVGVTSSKFKTLGTADDLKSLILAKDGVVVSAKPDAAVKKVMKWKMDEGVKFLSVGAFVPELTSMVSVESLLHTAESGTK